MSAQLCSLVPHYLLLLQLQHVLQRKHLLCARMELFLLFHPKSVKAHHRLRQKSSLVLLRWINHLAWVGSPLLVPFIGLSWERLRHFRCLNESAVWSSLDLSHMVQILTEVQLCLTGHLLAESGVISDLIYLIV